MRCVWDDDSRNNILIVYLDFSPFFLLMIPNPARSVHVMCGDDTEEDGKREREFMVMSDKVNGSKVVLWMAWNLLWWFAKKSFWFLINFFSMLPIRLLSNERRRQHKVFEIVGAQIESCAYYGSRRKTKRFTAVGACCWLSLHDSQSCVLKRE